MAPKTYFDLPKNEVLCFFDNIYESWCYQFIDNSSLDLNHLNPKLKKISIPIEWSTERVFEYFEQRFPESEVIMYENSADWIKDFEEGCYR